jgi:hypothetical protein
MNMQKLPLRERRRIALLNRIARLTLARNKAIQTLVKAETALPKLDRQLRRAEQPPRERKPKPVEHPKAAARERKIADALVSDVTDISMSEMLGDDLRKTAHMEALGFRKLTRSRRRAGRSAED